MEKAWRYAPLFLALTLLLSGCDSNEEEDPSEIERMVILEDEEEESSLITDAQEPQEQVILGPVH
jgi:hypothetical protein